MGEQFCYDLLGVGVGPYNLSLAALSDGLVDHSVFLERSRDFSWHPGLLLPEAKLQVSVYADLVTLVSPTSKYSFANYLHSCGRLYQFYQKNSIEIDRSEYADYCKWVAAQLSRLKFGHDVVEACVSDGKILVTARGEDDRVFSGVTRNLVLGIGTVPSLPVWAQGLRSERFVHSSDFLGQLSKLKRAKNVLVVGSGQSGAECFLTLLEAMEPANGNGGKSLTWATRSQGFFSMESAALGLELVSMAYTSYFESLDISVRRDVARSQGVIYKNASIGTLNRIYELLYKNVAQAYPNNVRLYTSCGINSALVKGGELGLQFVDLGSGREMVASYDAVVLATGYKHDRPKWFRQLLDSIGIDLFDEIPLDTHFQIVAPHIPQDCSIFVQNPTVVEKGPGSPDLGMTAIRSAMIVNRILKRQVYELPKKSLINFGLE